MATKLKNLTLREVSLVDRGANQHAHVTLFKRDGAADAILAGMNEAAEALAKSVSEILKGEAADIPADLEETFKQYHDHIQKLVPDGVGKVIDAAIAAHSVTKGNTMTDAEKKAADEQVKKLADTEAALAKANKELAFAKISEAHKAYVAEKKIEGEALDAFVAKSAADRDAQIKAEPVVKVVDAEIAKRDAVIADLQKRAALLEETNAKAEFAKKAVDLGLTEAHGETLRKAYGGDKEAMVKIEQLIKGLTEQVKTGKVFEEFGVKNGGDATTAKSRVDARVAEMQKIDPTQTREQAVAKISASPADRELWTAYKAEGVKA